LLPISHNSAIIAEPLGHYLCHKSAVHVGTGEPGAPGMLLSRAFLVDRDIEELRRDNNFPTWFGFLHEDVPRITIDTRLDGFSVLRPMHHYFVHLLANASTILCAIKDE